MRFLPVLLCLLCACPAAGRGRAGSFDYYVLSLGWQPSWCSLTGDARHDPQCDAGEDRGFILHGLWPQYESGWPSDCQTAERPPSRRDTAAMADIMGSSGLAWHEWQKHGSCSGLSAPDYFALARRAYRNTHVPAYLSPLHRDLQVPPDVVEQAFIEANPDLRPDAITVTCESGRIGEVRICLDKDLQPRACAADTARDCPLSSMLMEQSR